MIRMSVLSLSIAVLCVFSCNARAFSAPSVQAESAILINAETGAVIYEKNADTRLAPASLTKMMTCILGLESKGQDAACKISPAAAATEYSYLGMKGGEKILSGELMREMMIESDNGAAVAIAQNVSGNILKFADRMNEKAKELGCRKTHFSNPNGLTAKWHYSTARDLSKIAAYCMKNPEFRRIVSNRDATIHWVSPAGKTYHAETTNDLLHTYSGANGIKTGWTNAAKGCVAASAKRGDVELIAIVLKSPNTETRFADAKSLLDYGFSAGGKGKLPAEKPKEVKTGRMPDIKKTGNTPRPSTGATGRTSESSPAPVTGTNRPAATADPGSAKPTAGAVPAVAKPTADTPAVTGTTTAAKPAPDTGATGSPASAPAVKNTGIRMPVVRRPGA